MNAKKKMKKLDDKKRVQGFEVVEDACIWMKAGVINFRICDNDYDCNNCPFDLGMRKAMGMKKGQPKETMSAGGWVDYLKKSHDGATRPCRHALTGRIDAPKICTMNYECYHCPFDQILDEVDLGGRLEAPPLSSASGYRMAGGYYYHMGHGWARFEHGGRARIGLDDFSSKVFGCPRQLMLPPLGEKLKQNQVGWTFKKGSHEAAVLSPVTGVVLAVNHNALEHPEIVTIDPYHEGWLFILEPMMPKKDVKGLYFGHESTRWMEHESNKLLSLMGPEYENLAATGAEPLDDVAGSFPEIGWQVLVEAFLRTGKK